MKIGILLVLSLLGAALVAHMAWLIRRRDGG